MCFCLVDHGNSCQNRQHSKHTGRKRILCFFSFFSLKKKKYSLRRHIKLLHFMSPIYIHTHIRKSYIVRNLMQTNWCRLSFLFPSNYVETCVHAFVKHFSSNRRVVRENTRTENERKKRRRIKMTDICKHTEVVICLIFNTQLQWHICHG